MNKKLKIKIFQNAYIEQEINKWFSANPGITIVDITQSAFSDRIAISIFYYDS